MKQAVDILTLGEITDKVASICLNYPVLKAYVFGSYARGEQDAASDIDLYIELDESKPIGGFAVGGLYSDLESALGKELDTVFSNQYMLQKRKPRLHGSIERDKVLIYERKEK